MPVDARASQRRVFSELDDHLLAGHRADAATRRAAESVRPFWRGESGRSEMRAGPASAALRRFQRKRQRQARLAVRQAEQSGLSAGTIIGNRREGRNSCSCSQSSVMPASMSAVRISRERMDPFVGARVRDLARVAGVGLSDRP